MNPGAIAAPNYVTRQRLQSVALLFIRDDGVLTVVHLDLAAPERPFVPQIDWQAGFAAAHSQFTESLMTPDLEVIWKELIRLVNRLTRTCARSCGPGCAEFWSAAGRVSSS